MFLANPIMSTGPHWDFSTRHSEDDILKGSPPLTVLAAELETAISLSNFRPEIPRAVCRAELEDEA